MRNTIKDILRMLPGYEGYENRENRRDADKTLRMNLARLYKGERETLTRVAQKAVDRGQFDHLDRLEELGQALDQFIARLESVPRGYASWFDQVTIDETDLDQIYEFDARLADSVPLLREQLEYVEKAFNTSDQVDDSLDSLRTFVSGLNRQLDERQEFVALGKRPD